MRRNTYLHHKTLPTGSSSRNVDRFRLARRATCAVSYLLTLLLVLPSNAWSEQPMPETTAAGKPAYSLQEHEGGVKVLCDGNLVADYLTRSQSKPILWPIIGPGGKKMTRDYPMAPAGKFEKDDHPHHRSLWMTHGEVNGTDFWLEGGKGGVTAHQRFTKLSAGESAVVAAENIWQTAEGKPVLTEVRRYTFSNAGEHQIIDCEFKFAATHGDVNFGDTKEGTFGMRIAGSMKVEAGQGGVLLNNHGQKNKDAWGKRADWVDYVGPIDGEMMGIAILCHPTTYNAPNRWHVRTYGLFAANPFGEHHFENAPTPTKGVDLKSGDSLTLRYRVVLHAGDTEQAGIAELFKDYAKATFEDL